MLNNHLLEQLVSYSFATELFLLFPSDRRDGVFSPAESFNYELFLHVFFTAYFGSTSFVEQFIAIVKRSFVQILSCDVFFVS